MAIFNPSRKKAAGKRKLVNDIFVVMEKGLGKEPVLPISLFKKEAAKELK